MPITRAQLAAWKELEQAATKGPWTHFNDRSEPTGRVHRLILERTGRLFVSLVCMMSEGPGDHEADAAFIAASRQALPALIAEVERLQQALTQFNYAKVAAACVSDGRLPFVITADGQILPPEED